MRLLLVACLLAHGAGLAAQRVTNVTAEQQGQELVIHYALDADGPVDVQLFLSTDRGRTWQGDLKGCTGDLGKGVAPGTAKRIRWNVLQDRELVGDGVQFKVVAKGEKVVEIKPHMEYRDMIYDLIASNFSDFKRTRKEFNERLDADTAYAGKVYDVIAPNFADFKKTREEFMSLLYVAKRNSGASPPWLNQRLSYGSVTDIDGNTYATIKIGTQEWMAENLRTTRYRDGSGIPNVTDGNAWMRLSSGAWCNYDNNPIHDAAYGKHYNWYAVADKRGLCPQGWHLPMDTEWNKLIDYLGRREEAGGKMMTTMLWHDIEVFGPVYANESGFSGLPGGIRTTLGEFHHRTRFGFWWISLLKDASQSWGGMLGGDGPDISDYGYQTGLCVRCIRD